MLRMSCSPLMAWMTEPAPRNSRALKKACVKTWKTPAANAPDAEREEHVSQLRDGGIGQHALDVVLHQAMDAAKSAVSAPMMATVFIEPGASTNSAFDRATIYTPAVTMVAAWIRAETGVGPSIASGSQTYSGSWADLPQAPTNSNSVAAVMMGSPMAKCPLRAMCGDIRQAQRPEVPGDGEHAQQESGVTDAIDDECLVGGVAGGLAMEVETDQQIRTQADAFPSDEHQGVVVRQDEREHGEHEQVQVSEEAVIAAFVRHVSGGIDVDERAHAGDEQQPDGGERIEQEAGIGLEGSGRAVVFDVVQVAGVGAQPGVDDFLERLARVVVSVSRVLPDGAADEDERHGHRSHTDRADRTLPQLAAEEEHDGRAEGGEQRDQPDVVEEKHISRRSSVFSWL